MATLLIAAIGCTAATSASAGPKVHFDVRTKKADTPGWAWAHGTVQLQKKGKKWRVVLKGRLKDKCPADDYGAYIQLAVGLYDTGSIRTTREDRRDCKTKGKLRIEHTTPWRKEKPYTVNLWAYEYDADTEDYAERDESLRFYSPAELGHP